MHKAIVVSSYDVYSPSSWAGIPYHFTAALQKITNSVVVLSPLEPRFMPFTKIKRRYYEKARRWYMPSRDIELAQRRARHVNAMLSEHSDADVLFTFHPPDVAFLNTEIPIAIIHDGIWRQFTSTYPHLLGRHLADESDVEGATLERLAFNKATWIFFFTEWAAQAARETYPKLRAGIHTVLPGANFSNVPNSSYIQQKIDIRIRNNPTLLFVGKDGYRKGADIAIDVQKILQKDKVNSKLLLVGISAIPNAEPLFDARVASEVVCNNIFSHPYLDKGNAFASSTLHDFYLESFLLLVPSRAEFSSMAICDAAALGTPAISSNVGGNSELVINHETGILVPPGSPPDTYARAIKDLLDSPKLYSHMCSKVRLRYETYLNWAAHLALIDKTVSATSP
jgi:glycosyltransferase involved in cell wall biosynthesis